MTQNEFLQFRKLLGKTQKQMAELLGTSLKAVHSYEQGWRKIPPHVERQLLFLVFRKGEAPSKRDSCWEVKGCPENQRDKCPAWEFQSGHLCWFINGTFCGGMVQKDWDEKMRVCKDCEVLKPIYPERSGGRSP